ncbi:DNA mismatch endonuclease Vsr [Pseudomonas mosselii]|uniref:very short patch repair endonuclease n=1 Tax=Pseudomonas mosselii TaxID=78327 RepID=UPI0021A83979|nr:DNA mismatch endonuclease Vsr [Pseudomonas mosselii]MEA3234102.1 DNA mismatch endonuclease Vsr [Pseudomonas mosselii]UWS69254.1 DNA mismatch endonuclease Vsr [Pseudomonas mosselii]
MRVVKAKDTSPELVVKRIIYALGCRFRLHRRDLPGKPDLVFIRHRKVIFVHGCFWHGHDCPRRPREPKTNTEYWHSKIARNRERDIENAARLAALGWRTHSFLECEFKDRAALAHRLEKYLEE